MNIKKGDKVFGWNKVESAVCVLDFIDNCNGYPYRLNDCKGQFIGWFAKARHIVVHTQTQEQCDKVQKLEGFEFLGKKWSKNKSVIYLKNQQKGSYDLVNTDDYHVVTYREYLKAFYPSELESKKEPYQFKVGDTVRVVKRVEVEEGWDNRWTSRMDKYIDDGIYKVSHVNSHGIGLGRGASLFSFPPSSLELVKEKEESKDEFPSYPVAYPISPVMSCKGEQVLSKDLRHPYTMEEVNEQMRSWSKMLKEDLKLKYQIGFDIGSCANQVTIHEGEKILSTYDVSDFDFRKYVKESSDAILRLNESVMDWCEEYGLKEDKKELTITIPPRRKPKYTRERIQLPKLKDLKLKDLKL